MPDVSILPEDISFRLEDENLVVLDDRQTNEEILQTGFCWIPLNGGETELWISLVPKEEMTEENSFRIKMTVKLPSPVSENTDGGGESLPTQEIPTIVEAGEVVEVENLPEAVEDESEPTAEVTEELPISDLVAE